MLRFGKTVKLVFQIVLELFTPTLSWSGGGLPNLGKIRKNLENSKFGFGGVFQLLDRGRHTLPKKNPDFSVFCQFVLVCPPLVGGRSGGSGGSRFGPPPLGRAEVW